MKVNTAKQKMQAGQPAFGYALGLGSALAAEIVGGSGIDFVLLDTQHGSWGPDSTIAGLVALSSGSAAPMARVATNNYTQIGRLLDEGMLGIVVPMVHSSEAAKDAADACRYPPIGGRSWGWGRAAAYGDDYTEWIDSQLFVAVQIESAQAVDNAEAIMATPGINGCWVGPADLALSMGIHPRDAAMSDRHTRAVEKVLEACRNTGKIAGYAGGSPEEAVGLAERGFRFVTAGSDVGFLRAGLRAGLRTLRGES